MSYEFPTRKELREQALDELNDVFDHLNEEQIHHMFRQTPLDSLHLLLAAIRKKFPELSSEE